MCNRCQSNGYECSYSPSRRHGKHSWKKFSELNMAPLGMTITHEPSMDVDSGDGQAGSGSTGSRSDDFNFVDFNALGEGFDISSHWNGTDSGIDLSSGFGSPHDIQTHDRMVSGANSIWTRPSSIPIAAISEASNILEAPPPQRAPYDCEEEAFNALHSIHSCTMLHTDHPGEPKQTLTRMKNLSGVDTDHMPSLDKVLYFNRAAISTLKDLLNVPSAQQSHLALLYMTIASKVLFWYRLVISSQYTNPRSSSVSSTASFANQTPSLSSTSSSTSDRAVRPVSVQIGVFDLEDEDQKVLMMGVLLREVRKLESVVDKMKMLGEEYTRDDEYSNQGQISNWYAVVGSKMQTEVQDTLKQIKEFSAGMSRREKF